MDRFKRIGDGIQDPSFIGNWFSVDVALFPEYKVLQGVDRQMLRILIETAYEHGWNDCERKGLTK